MERFAELLDRLVYTTARNAKLRLLEDYFREAPDPDRGWALAALTDGLPFSPPLKRTLQALMTEQSDPVLYRLSRDYVGDTAETVSLLWPDRHTGPAPTLSGVVEQARTATGAEFSALMRAGLDCLDSRGRFALIKLFSGALRVGVSSRLAKVALANLGPHDADAVEELWHGLSPPYLGLFPWAMGEGPRPEAATALVFRPVMLAHPVEDTDWANLNPQDWVAEWKWDGIRIQIAADATGVRLFSRAGDDISAAFPDVAGQFLGHTGVFDGELLVAHNGVIAGFNELQQRLNRKSVTRKMLTDAPGFVRLYDILFEGARDVRPEPFDTRRALLEAFVDRAGFSCVDLSALVPFETFADLTTLWASTRRDGIEGLMLKRRDSSYQGGRVRGSWFKWKRAPLTLDCVMMYAQRGSGKRSSFYSDFTFGVWDGNALVPVGKSYSGFTDAELLELDRFVRNNTSERFGPVRAVKAGLVLEIAFDAIQKSPRHKSGFAMRFPRIARLRFDKPAQEAATLDEVRALAGRADTTTID